MPHSELVRLQFEFACKVFTAAHSALPALDYGAPPPEAESFRLQLHLTILEMAGGCLALFAKEIYSPIYALIRVAYDALVDQTILARSPAYVGRMNKTAFEEGRNLPRLMHLHGHGMREQFMNEQGRKLLADVRRANQAIPKQDTMTAEEKFAEAGMETEYILHRILSGHVHNDTSALLGRHGTRRPGGAMRYEAFKVLEDAELCTLVCTAARLLLRSCQAMNLPLQAFPDELTRIERENAARWPRLFTPTLGTSA